MKTFRQFLSEETFNRILPAVRHKKSKKLFIGKRGDYHSDLLTKAHPKWQFRGQMEPDEQKTFLQYDRGYYDPREKKFLSRDQAGGIDSQELRSKYSMFLEEKKKKKT